MSIFYDLATKSKLVCTRVQVQYPRTCGLGNTYKIKQKHQKCKNDHHKNVSQSFKGVQYLLIIQEVLVPAGVEDETLKEESQRLIAVTIMILTEYMYLFRSIQYKRHLEWCNITHLSLAPLV